MTTGALQADVTPIMVCVSTRPTVQRETIVRVTGDVKVKLSTTHGSCVPLLDEGLVAQSDQHNSPSGDKANSDEQDETIVNSVSSSLLLSQEKRVDDDSSRQCKKNVAQDVERSVVRRPAERAASRGANSARGRRVHVQVSWCARDVEENDGEAHRRTSRACKRRGAHPRTISRQHRARLRPSSRARTRDASQEGTLYSAFPACIAYPPQLPSSARELEDLTTDLINMLQTEAPSETRAIEKIAQLTRDQDVKIEDIVGRIQSVLGSLAVRLRDDAVFATKARIARVRDQGKDCEAQSDPQPHDNDRRKSRFETTRRGQDDQMISQGGAVLQRMRRMSLLGGRKPSIIAC